MRRIVIPLMLAVALLRPSGAQQRKSDLEQAGLKGKVKTIEFEVWRPVHLASRQSSNTMPMATDSKKCRPGTKGS